MSSLRTRQQECKMCDLCNNMDVSPVAIEFFGKPPIDVLFVIGSKVKQRQDDYQEVLSGPDKKILESIFQQLKLTFATTMLVKCKTSNSVNTKKNVNDCEYWTEIEVSELKPKLIIGVGNVKYSNIKFDMIIGPLNKILSSSACLSQIINDIENAINDKHI